MSSIGPSTSAKIVPWKSTGTAWPPRGIVVAPNTNLNSPLEDHPQWETRLRLLRACPTPLAGPVRWNHMAIPPQGRSSTGARWTANRHEAA